MNEQQPPAVVRTEVVARLLIHHDNGLIADGHEAIGDRDRMFRFANWLIEDEGLRLTSYFCSAGNLTIGVGHRLQPDEIDRYADGIAAATSRQIATWLMRDVSIAIRAVRRALARSTWLGICGTTRLCALTSMAFNLGGEGLMAFKKTLAAVNRQDWRAAGAHAVDSAWADSPRQDARAVGRRAWRTAWMLRTGEWW